jgi:hypothetical protein
VDNDDDDRDDDLVNDDDDVDDDDDDVTLIAMHHDCDRLMESMAVGMHWMSSPTLSRLLSSRTHLLPRGASNRTTHQYSL